MEMLVVMVIMVILLGVGFSAYASFTETTKYNQDVANLQSDILIMQRAAMLLERDETEDWLYGLGIDFGGILSSNGEYRYFKWCSPYSEFGHASTKSRYPYYIEDDTIFDGVMPYPVKYNHSKCNNNTNEMLALTGYGRGDLALEEDVEIYNLEGGIFDIGSIQYLLFESVSGRAFLYDSSGNRIPNDIDLAIVFNKNFGIQKALVVDNLTGRTKVIDYVE